ncbi:unnamed protein product [Heligmosomoides polygyrus]|uniref:Protein UL46 n=1 Tax=Heligmosomoides polygyrus TaxID=6339 RepID=A0A183GAK7_HELPZ|nr:unnamed protein product [Heligmosomoides polygyrus]
MDYSIVVSHDDPDPDDDDEEIFCVYLEYLIEKCERFFRRFVAIRTRILRRVRKGLTRANARLRRRLGRLRQDGAELLDRVEYVLQLP